MDLSFVLGTNFNYLGLCELLYGIDWIYLYLGPIEQYMRGSRINYCPPGHRAPAGAFLWYYPSLKVSVNSQEALNHVRLPLPYDGDLPSSYVFLEYVEMAHVEAVASDLDLLNHYVSCLVLSLPAFPSSMFVATCASSNQVSPSTSDVAGYGR